MSKKHLYWLVDCLCLLATGLLLYKTLVLKLPLSPNTLAEVWNVEVRLHYTPTEGPAKIQLHIPRSNSRHAITHEQFISSDYGLGIRQAAINNSPVSVSPQRGTVTEYNGNSGPIIVFAMDRTRQLAL